MLSAPIDKIQQIPLIHEIHSDEQHLLNTIDGEWFGILHHFHWQDYRQFGADYYNALYDFNQRSAQTTASKEANSETKAEARQRLLFDRVTAPILSDTSKSVLYQGDVVDLKSRDVTAADVSPGEVPLRLVGRKPKCFFGLLKAFIGTSLMGFPAEPEKVELLLKSNPAFARVCGFFHKNKKLNGYHYQQVPSLRKLEQFDQIMTDAGIWGRLKLTAVKANLATGVIQPEGELVGDTTHYHAYSSFETVLYLDEKEKEQKKSQSKPTKNCQCEDWNHCPHEWVLCDDGAGTIVKSGKKMIWGHKASIIGLPKQGVAIDAIAVADAATHDGQTFFPHVERVLGDHADLAQTVHRVLYDSACDDAELKLQFEETFGVELKASFNPRRSKAITQNLPRGIEKITPYGVPICLAGYGMDYQGIRYANETFIYRAPLGDDGLSVCVGCHQRPVCCNRSAQAGRTITVSFDTLKHIDANDPPMAKRFKAIMTRRPSVERMIKRLKCDLGDDRLSKRGNDSFQAYLDKTLISYHLLIRHLN
ncbi:MAG: hypothetical protein ABW166_14975 [Sedimenticola sp.]